MKGSWIVKTTKALEIGDIIKPLLIIALIPTLIGALGVDLGDTFDLITSILPLVLVLSIMNELDFGGEMGEVIKPLIVIPFVFQIVEALGVTVIDPQLLDMVTTVVLIGVIMKVFEEV